jgi:hypothetical protein
LLHPPTPTAIPLKWTTTGFIKPGSAVSTNPIPPAIVHHTALTHDLVHKAKQMCSKLMGDGGELSLMRLHTKKCEYIVAPGEQDTLVIVQKTHSASMDLLKDLAPAAAAPAAEAVPEKKK